MSQKKALRAAIRSALSNALPDISWAEDWWARLNIEDLPLGGVSTMRETPQRAAVGLVSRRIDIVVVLKRFGAEAIEDALDDDAAAIEPVVLGVLDGVSDDFDLVSVDVRPDAVAEHIVGELIMSFRAVLKTPEGNPT